VECCLRLAGTPLACCFEGRGCKSQTRWPTGIESTFPTSIGPRDVDQRLAARALGLATAWGHLPQSCRCSRRRTCECEANSYDMAVGVYLDGRLVSLAPVFCLKKQQFILEHQQEFSAAIKGILNATVKTCFLCLKMTCSAVGVARLAAVMCSVTANQSTDHVTASRVSLTRTAHTYA
jgi:hypothetical protein